MNPEDQIQRDRTATDYPLFAQIFAGEPQATRDAQIYKRWKTYHIRNPHVFEHFCRFAFQVINAGKKRYSADAILHQIRWHVEIEIRSNEAVRINNDFARPYGDLFGITYPAHADLFEKRRRTSEDRPACSTDLSVVDTGPAQANASQDYDMTELAHSNTKEFHGP